MRFCGTTAVHARMELAAKCCACEVNRQRYAVFDLFLGLVLMEQESWSAEDNGS